jgi:hypothetical protein
VTDYGDPDTEEGFKWVLPYSPLHNAVPPAGGTRQYPAFMLTTGDHDDRVVPLHSHKLIATLQNTLAGGRARRAGVWVWGWGWCVRVWGGVVWWGVGLLSYGVVGWLTVGLFVWVMDF